MTLMDGEALSLALFGRPLDPRGYLLGFYPNAPIPPLDHVVRTAEPLPAEVHHGVWVARCGCGARGLPRPGGVVFVETPLVWCLRCLNAGTGRGWRPVAVPPAEEREAIDAILDCRPNVEDRNWSPGQALAELATENVEHGDPVPLEV